MTRTGKKAVRVVVAGTRTSGRVKAGAAKAADVPVPAAVVASEPEREMARPEPEEVTPKAAAKSKTLRVAPPAPAKPTGVRKHRERQVRHSPATPTKTGAPAAADIASALRALCVLDAKMTECAREFRSVSRDLMRLFDQSAATDAMEESGDAAAVPAIPPPAGVPGVPHAEDDAAAGAAERAPSVSPRLPSDGCGGGVPPSVSPSPCPAAAGPAYELDDDVVMDRTQVAY